MLEGPIQKLGTFTCGPFQLLFWENVFEPNENSKIQNDRKLTKKPFVELNHSFLIRSEVLPLHKKVFIMYLRLINSFAFLS